VSDDETFEEGEIILSPELEGVVRQFGGYFENVFQRLGEVEARVGKIGRLLSIRLNTKLMGVPDGDVSDAAELLKGIREGVEIETVLLDIGQRLYDLEYHCFAPKPTEEDEQASPDLTTQED
jgi:hypothetical protein